MSPRPLAPVASPDAASWTLAAGVSVSLHIGLAAALVVALSTAPGAAPGPGPEIILRSVPQVAGGGQEAMQRVAASTPQARIAPQDDLSPTQDSPSRTTATTAEARALAALDSTARLAAQDAAPAQQQARPAEIQPDTPRMSAETVRPLAIVRSQPDQLRPIDSQPEAARTTALRPQQAEVPRVAPGVEPRVSAELAPARPPSQEAAPRVSPAASVDGVAPMRVQPIPDAPRPGSAPQRLTASSPAPATSQNMSAQDTLRQAMLPPTVDTLERALRDRPRRFLSDRRAAPRPTLSDATGGGAQASAPGESNAADQPLFVGVLEHLRSLPDIPCFAALPTLDRSGQLLFEVFGPAQTGLEAFRASLESEAGQVSGMVLRTVTQGQCETLDFIRRNRAYPAFSLYLTMAERRVPRGDQVLGQIHMSTARTPGLLLIDNAGRVQSLARFLSPDDDLTASFRVPMTLQGPAVETWQLLLAVATDSPLRTIETLTTPQDAASFFARLRAEIATGGHAADLALIAFSLN